MVAPVCAGKDRYSGGRDRFHDSPHLATEEPLPIAVRPDIAPAQAVKTLIHELAHALLHDKMRSSPATWPKSRSRAWRS
jgi:hypothetical protein